MNTPITHSCVLVWAMCNEVQGVTTCGLRESQAHRHVVMRPRCVRCSGRRGTGCHVRPAVGSAAAADRRGHALPHPLAADAHHHGRPHPPALHQLHHRHKGCAAGLTQPASCAGVVRALEASSSCTTPGFAAAERVDADRAFDNLRHALFACVVLSCDLPVHCASEGRRFFCLPPRRPADGEHYAAGSVKAQRGAAARDLQGTAQTAYFFSVQLTFSHVLLSHMSATCHMCCCAA